MSSRIEFFLFEDDSPVGGFEAAEPPLTAGDYNYMPFRSVGHYRLVERVRAGNAVQCYCNSAQTRVVFVITAIPSYGRISLSPVGGAG